MVLYGTRGENGRPGRPFRDDPRNKLRGVVAVPENSVVGRVDLEKLEPEMVLNLFGLSPGILIRALEGLVFVLAESDEKLVCFGLLDGWLKSAALTDWDNLLDGLAGRSMILREDS
jgi:hypothetical protein